jgi:cyclophilin family peptidyl-prolyl cis-trans isomerase
MIVSHAHRFVFVKPRKTAGTSAELALSPYLEPGDIATPVQPEEESQRHIRPGVRIDRVRRGPVRLRDHSSLSRIYFVLPKVRDYRVISMARNPWDRAVSQFFWTHRRTDIRSATFQDQKALFNAFTQKWGPRTWLDPLYGRKRQRALDSAHLYWLDGRCRADFVIRYEHLSDDLAALGDWIGLDSAPSITTSAKTGLRPKTRPWADFYEDGTRDLVARECRREIELFGYDFKGTAPIFGPQISV